MKKYLIVVGLAMVWAIIPVMAIAEEGDGSESDVTLTMDQVKEQAKTLADQFTQFVQQVKDEAQNVGDDDQEVKNCFIGLLAEVSNQFKMAQKAYTEIQNATDLEAATNKLNVIKSAHSYLNSVAGNPNVCREKSVAHGGKDEKESSEGNQMGNEKIFGSYRPTDTFNNGGGLNDWLNVITNLLDEGFTDTESASGT